MADEQRIAVLEQHIRALYEQVSALREELRARGGARRAPAATAPDSQAAPSASFASAAPPNIAAPSTPTPSAAAPVSKSPSAPRTQAPKIRPTPAPDIDFEKFLGRYGTIAVASLAILMGVGTFLSWAIEHGYLGPTVRVVLGFIGAGIVAGVGLWIRDKRDVRFGNVLLALSLAIVHVDAWAAGPYLGVLSTLTALTIAAAASAALAALALTSDELTLFAIGFAGALVAPFVTAKEPGSVVMLLTYGWVVIALSLIAIREREWQSILWLPVIGAALYIAAAVEMPSGFENGWLPVHAPVIFAFACTAAGLLFARDSLRSKLALAFLFLACGATLGYSIHARSLEVSVSLVGIVASYLIARELETDVPWLVLGNIIVPLGFMFATIASATDRTIQALAAAALTVVAAVLALEDEEERPYHLFVAAIASAVAIFCYLVDFDTRCIAALALHAAIFSIAFRSTRARMLFPPILIVLLIASAWTLFILANRPQYAYTPFLTIPSLCALATVGAWTVFAFAVKPTPEEKEPESRAMASLIGGFAIVAAFLWVRQELVDAWSRDTSSFAIIIYYALAGLALIFAGRLRRVGLWRAAGLALAFFAGYKALVETFTIDAVGLRVGARILVGVFLAAVAYWYRVPSVPSSGNPPASGETPVPPVGATVSD